MLRQVQTFSILIILLVLAPGCNSVSEQPSSGGSTVATVSAPANPTPSEADLIDEIAEALHSQLKHESYRVEFTQQSGSGIGLTESIEVVRPSYMRRVATFTGQAPLESIHTAEAAFMKPPSEPWKKLEGDVTMFDYSTLFMTDNAVSKYLSGIGQVQGVRENPLEGKSAKVYTYMSSDNNVTGSDMIHELWVSAGDNLPLQLYISHPPSADGSKANSEQITYRYYDYNAETEIIEPDV